MPAVARWGPVVAYMGAIFLLSAQPQLPSFPSQVSDKHVHALTYAGLAAVTCRALAGGALARLTAGDAVGAWAIAVAYGASDEYHQSFVPGRTPDLDDWAADAAGAAAAAAACYAWGIISRSRRVRERTSSS